jgi:hypothetical protein
MGARSSTGSSLLDARRGLGRYPNRRESLTQERAHMNLSERAISAWQAFLDNANPQMLHDFDVMRLYRFLASAYVDGCNVDLEACENDMASLSVEVREEVLILMDSAADLFEALDEVGSRLRAPLTRN